NNDMDLDEVLSSVTSFETNTLAENSSCASFSQHAQLREAANRHITQNRQIIYNLMKKKYKAKKRSLNFKPGDLIKI
ncbi:13694_t:CDS:1, partial [Racocetra persica]